MSDQLRGLIDRKIKIGI